MFNFAWPWLFTLLPLPWLLYRVLPPARPEHSAIFTPFFNDLQRLHTQQRRLFSSSLSRGLSLACIWLLLLCAAARPQLTLQEQQLHQQGRDLLLAIDLSDSMQQRDMGSDAKPLSRLEFVKQFARQLIEQRPQDRIGLILFASQAYLLTPLTFDHATLLHWLDSAEPGMAGHNTAIGDAIGLSIKRLRDQPAKHKVLLLITDGAHNSGVMPPITATHLAATHNIKIYPLGVGRQASEHSTPSPHDLDEPLLRDIAQLTRGRYLRLDSLQNSGQVIEQLAQLERATHPNIQYQVRALHSWPLTAALLLSLALAGLNWGRRLSRHTPTQVSP